MHAVNPILWYIKGTLFYGITFYRDFSLHLLAYPDIDWVVDVSIDALSLVIVFFLDTTLLVDCQETNCCVPV